MSTIISSFVLYFHVKIGGEVAIQLSPYPSLTQVGNFPMDFPSYVVELKFFFHRQDCDSKKFLRIYLSFMEKKDIY